MPCSRVQHHQAASDLTLAENVVADAEKALTDARAAALAAAQARDAAEAELKAASAAMANQEVELPASDRATLDGLTSMIQKLLEAISQREIGEPETAKQALATTAASAQELLQQTKVPSAQVTSAAVSGDDPLATQVGDSNPTQEEVDKLIANIPANLRSSVAQRMRMTQQGVADDLAMDLRRKEVLANRQSRSERERQDGSTEPAARGSYKRGAEAAICAKTGATKAVHVCA